jgi:hypothetical protein
VTINLWDRPHTPRGTDLMSLAIGKIGLVISAEELFHLSYGQSLYCWSHVFSTIGHCSKSLDEVERMETMPKHEVRKLFENPGVILRGRWSNAG